jgi:hypothetical protein
VVAAPFMTRPRRGGSTPACPTSSSCSGRGARRPVTASGRAPPGQSRRAWRCAAALTAPGSGRTTALAGRAAAAADRPLSLPGPALESVVRWDPANLVDDNRRSISYRHPGPRMWRPSIRRPLANRFSRRRTTAALRDGVEEDRSSDDPSGSRLRRPADLGEALQSSGEGARRRSPGASASPLTRPPGLRSSSTSGRSAASTGFPTDDDIRIGARATAGSSTTTARAASISATPPVDRRPADPHRARPDPRPRHPSADWPAVSRPPA